jgi:phosphocarrier protein
MRRSSIEIINTLGLHARAAAKFVQTAARFASHIEVSCGAEMANGKSIMGIMMLAAGKGSILHLMIAGEDETEALLALQALIQNRFDEAE